jgi:hypothetical protein
MKTAITTMFIGYAPRPDGKSNRLLTALNATRILSAELPARLDRERELVWRYQKIPANVPWVHLPPK